MNLYLMSIFDVFDSSTHVKYINLKLTEVTSNCDSYRLHIFKPAYFYYQNLEIDNNT